MKRFTLLLLAWFALPAPADVLIGIGDGSGGEPPADSWIFDELADDTGTSGSCTGSDCTITAKGQDDKVEGAMLYRVVPAGQDVQIIACFDGFTGTTHNFSAAAVGISQDGNTAVSWGRTTKHAVGRISAKSRPTDGSAVVVTQGSDTDSEPCHAATFDYSAQQWASYVSPTADGNPTNDDWAYKRSPSNDFTIAGDYRAHVFALSNIADSALTADFVNVSYSNTITIAVGGADPECSDGVDNDGDTDIDFPADAGCADADDDDESDTPPPEPQCSDSEDNDGDGDTDFPADAGCSDADDNSENSDAVDPCLIDPEDCEPPAQGTTDWTFQGDWFAGQRNIFGWYFAYPDSWEKPSVGGIFSGDNCVPLGYEGRSLRDAAWDWRDLETSNNNFSGLQDLIADIEDDTEECDHDNNDNTPTITVTFDGVMLNPRGLLTERLDYSNPACTGTGNANDSVRTAPQWLINMGIPTIQENCHSAQQEGFKTRHFDMTNATLQAQYKELVQAFGAEGICEMDRVRASIIHAVGTTSGEEFTGKQKQTAAGRDAWACTGYPGTPAGHRNCILAYWEDFCYVNDTAWKAGLVTDQPQDLFDRWIKNGNMGWKGYNIEFFLGGATAGPNNNGELDVFGIIWDEDGYQTVDPDHVAIQEARHYQTQNENYRCTETQLGPPEKCQQRYRMSTMRLLAMQFNVVWIETARNRMNPPLTNWMGMQIGHTEATTPNAFVMFLEAHRWFGGQSGEVLPVRNFERWAYQRDSEGTCTPALEVTWGYDPTGGNDLLPTQFEDGRIACEFTSLDIALDDAISWDTSVAVKATYWDDSNGSFTMQYDSNGATAGGLVTLTADEDDSTGGNQQQSPPSNQIRTQVWCIDDFTAPATGYNGDLIFASSGDVPLMFVEVLDTDAACD